MPADFDPYHKWLGIPRWEQPPNHYRLLGLTLFESDADVIEGAADQRMAHVRTHQTGPHSVDSQKLLNGIAAAKLCLLSPDRKTAYDTDLMQRQRSLVSPENKWPVVQPKVVSPAPVPLAPPTRRRRPKYNVEVREPDTENPLRPLALLALVSAGVVVLVLVVRDRMRSPRQEVEPAVAATKSEPLSVDIEPKVKPAAKVTAEVSSPTPEPTPESSIPGAKDDEVPDFFETEEEKPAAEDFFSPDDPPAPAKSDMVHTFSIQKGTPGLLAFSPDGRRAASGGDNIVGCWDIAKKIQTWSSDELDPVMSVRFSPDGDRVFACTNKRLVIFNAESGKQLDSFDIGQPLQAATISNDCRLLGVIYGQDHSGAVYNIEQRRLIHKIAAVSWGPVVALSRNNVNLVFGDSQLGRFDISTGQLTQRHIVQPTNSVIVAADFSFDNEFLATGNQQESFPDVGQSMGDRMVRLWNVRNGQLVREFKDHREFILAVAFTPDGKRLLSGGGGNMKDFGAFGESSDRAIRLWDVGTGRVLRTFDGHKWRVDSLAVSPDGLHFLSGSIDRTMILWRLPD